MKPLQLFTKKLFDSGKVPTSLRDGTKLLSFHCIPEAGYHIFFGVTKDGRALSWKKDGHINGGKNLRTDIVFFEKDPDDIYFFLAISPQGVPYAVSTEEKLSDIKMPVASAFEFRLNTRTMDCIIDRAKLPKP